MRDFDLGNFGKERADHTVSIYFLGLLLFYNTHLNKKVFFECDISTLYEFFQFIWFITCLSHDTAFYLEKNKGLFRACPDIERLKGHLLIEYDLTTQSVDKVPKEMFELCQAYYLFRHNHPDHMATDHGIYAGLLMYDRLVKNRIEKKRDRDSELVWEDWLDPQYAYAAATVAVHNIWFPKERDYQLYEKFGLRDLITKKPITITEAPLLYLLGIVDTIDPVKAYRDKDPEFVLKNVYLSFTSRYRFKIRVSKELDLAVMQLRVDNLKDWLSVKTLTTGKTITIILGR